MKNDRKVGDYMRDIDKIIMERRPIFCKNCSGKLYYQNGGSSLCWNIDVCTTSIPFFACGYLYKMNENTIDNWLTKKINIV